MMFELSRREALRQLGLIAAGRWLLPLVGSDAPAPRTPPELVFVVINDVHVTGEDCERFLVAVIDHAKAQGAEFCLLAGDLTEHGDRTSMERVKRAFENVGLSVYPVLGNHDYAGPTDRAAYESVFPARVNYAFMHGTWQFIGLDTTDGQKYRDTRVSEATLNWLQSSLPALSQTAPTVVFTHFPLISFLPMCPANAEAVLTRLRKLNLKAIFSGHYHGLIRLTHAGVEVGLNYCCALKRTNHDGTRTKGYYLVRAWQTGLRIDPVVFKVENNRPVFEDHQLAHS